MKSHIKINGVIQLTNQLGNMNAFESELLQNKYIKAGWRTRQEVLDLGLNPQDYPERLVIDREAREVILAEGQMVDASENITVLERTMTEQGVDTWIERYYIIPQRDHKEFDIPANYTIEQYDDSADIAAEAAEKAQRIADVAEIKTFIQSVNDSTLPNWHKKLLKFLIKDTK